MNPPPQGPGPALLTIPTINLMVGITLIMQAFLIGLSTRVIKSFRGVWEASAATFLLSLSFLMTIVFPPPHETLIPSYSNQLFFIGGFALVYLSISRFTNKPYNKWILFGVVPASFLAMTLSLFFPAGSSPLKVISLLTGTILAGTTAVTLWRSDHHRYKLSAYLTSITLALYSIVMLWQLIAGLFSKDVLLPMGTLTEKLFNLALFLASYLWTGGFILMVSQRLQSDLSDLAMNDALTRVRNRRAMDQLLEFEMQRVYNDVKDFSIILADLDLFKRVNDTYGHATGDIVLKWFASTIQNNLRVQDVIARWGGEEFLILLPDTNLDEAEQIGERLRKIIESSKVAVPDEKAISITFSAGISSSITNRDVKDLCKIADQALYIAKETRNRIITQDQIPGN